MRYLLDTHIYLWWLADDKKLTISTKKLIADEHNTIFVSLISFWEISIKMQRGKLPLKTSFVSLYNNLQFDLLTVNMEYVFQYNKLPLLHKDPFDRMLISQAIAENCTLITTDEKIKKYQVLTIG